MPNNEKDLSKAIILVANELQQKMDNILPNVGRCGEAKVLEAMRYSALVPAGKKLRPFLVAASAGLFGVGRQTSIQTAAAIEFIHVYSLIHDDLPAMDDDDTRRGQPSCHIKFGEAAAILAGDGLLTLAFEILSDETTHPSAQVRCDLIKEIAKAAGPLGMVGGQMMDLDAEHSTLSIDEIIHLQRMKTGAMFAVSCEAGAILGKAAPKLRMALRGYANAIGLAFQITDDLLDVESSTEATGKPVRQDKTKGKATLVSAIGIDRARNQAEMLVRQAKTHLEAFDERANILRQLADYIIERKG
jgi:farnesyl diphosphate synthase